ncbi:HD domain-containing protein [Acidicapsa ligni]|uniref:HD domain-containing protein n=1 Tax=Acidicapsa ligni TaxID=542300 RepID=UPI0021DF6362|nr:HD domain-containing protein [Acidicapsa ligni]
MIETTSTIDSPELLVQLLSSRGGDSYFGEPVTVLEHCPQAAFFAREAASANSLIVAALLHDVGHLLHHKGEDAAVDGLDTRHEELANQILSAHLPLSVTEPIRMHVAAKRYLCHVDPAYLNALSPSSLLSLGLQGGPMSEAEAVAFVATPFAQDAITLRHWDDEAKIPALAVPQASTYLPQIKAMWQ